MLHSDRRGSMYLPRGTTVRQVCLGVSAIVIYDGRMGLDPKSLKLFTRVVELGTIAAAAEREHIAAAAVSKRLADLEAELGAVLLVRNNKGIQPTATGRILVDLSRRVLNDLDCLREVMRDYARGAAGQVRVFANISAITEFLPEALSTFMARYPKVYIHLQERVSAAIVDAVRSNAADVGILIDRGPMEGIEYRPYRNDQLTLVVPTGHPLARRRTVRFAEALEFEFVGLHVNSQLNLQLLRAASDLGIAWKCRVHVTSYDALAHMVQSRLGIGVLPSRIGRAYAKALRIRLLSLDEPWARRTLVVAVRTFDAMAPAVRLLVEHLLSTPPEPTGRGASQGPRQAPDNAG